MAMVRPNSNRDNDFTRRVNELLRDTSAELTDEQHEAAKAATNARLEEVFPGLAEDEATISNAYEPSTEHYPHNYLIHRPSLDELFARDNEWYGGGEEHWESGTGPELVIEDGRPLIEPSEVERYFNRNAHSISDEDLDINTPDFGTGRHERNYGGFSERTHDTLSTAALNAQIGSPEYWKIIDRHNAEQRKRERDIRQNAEAVATRREAPAGWYENWQDIRRRRSQRWAGIAIGASQRRPSRHPRGSRGTRTNTRSGAEYAMRSEPFYSHSSNFSGRRYTQELDESATFATASSNPQITYDIDAEQGDINYVVYSYNTPIAWRLHDFSWRMPSHRYSRTTSRHQSAIRYALSNANYRSPQQVAENILMDRGRRQSTTYGMSPRVPLSYYRPNYEVYTYHNYSDDDLERLGNTYANRYMEQIVEPERARRAQILLRNRRARERQARRERRRPLESDNG
jgi:hypothetical protein